MFCGSGAHEAQDRPQAPLQTKLLAYSSHAEATKEWFYYPDAAEPPTSAHEGAPPCRNAFCELGHNIFTILPRLLVCMVTVAATVSRGFLCMLAGPICAKLTA